MSYAYPGNPNNNPANITLPEDGDNADAASVEVPFEGLKDSVAYLTARLGSYRLETVHTFRNGNEGPVILTASGGVNSAVFKLGTFATEVGDLIMWWFTGTFGSVQKGLAQLVHDVDDGALFIESIGFFPTNTGAVNDTELAHSASGKFTAINPSTDIGIYLAPGGLNPEMTFASPWHLVVQVWRPNT